MEKSILIFFGVTMQVFVPSEFLSTNIKLLDKKRAFKQVVECCDILKVLRGESKGIGWKNHPAVLSWQYNVEGLQLYAYYALEYVFDQGIKVNKTFEYIMNYPINPQAKLPIWWGDEEIHRSHRCRLLQKDYEFYSMYGWQQEQNWEEQRYLWAIYDNELQYHKEIRGK
jgi:hypothetical protein